MPGPSNIQSFLGGLAGGFGQETLSSMQRIQAAKAAREREIRAEALEKMRIASTQVPGELLSSMAPKDTTGESIYAFEKGRDYPWQLAGGMESGMWRERAAARKAATPPHGQAVPKWDEQSELKKAHELAVAQSGIDYKTASPEEQKVIDAARQDNYKRAVDLHNQQYPGARIPYAPQGTYGTVPQGWFKGLFKSPPITFQPGPVVSSDIAPRQTTQTIVPPVGAKKKYKLLSVE